MNIVFILTSRQTEIARSARGPKSQGHRAEDALAESYFVQEKFGDLITADHKVLSDNLRISKQSPICSRDARFGHPMDPVVSVQNKNFSGNTEKLAKVPGNPKGILKSFTLTVLWNLAKPVKIFPGIIVRQHRTVRKLMGLQKEQCVE